jgi:RHS repeat-associated protein
VVANSAGTTVWRWDQMEPFGVNVADENPSGLGAFEFPLRFPGQYADKETNLHYNYFRDYDSSIGRYVESDPIGLLAGLNTYAYVLGSPLSYVDPSGLDVKICHFPGGPTHIASGVGEIGDFIQTSGFYPARKRSPYGKGVIREDDLSEVGTKCKVIPTTEKEDDCLTRCQKRYEKDPGRYDWYRRNCSTYVRTCLKECGLPSGTDTFWPKTMYDSLPGTPVPATGTPTFYP